MSDDKSMMAIRRRALFSCEVELDLSSYLSGYADGEGCFCVSFARSERHKFGWDIRPSFSVSQNHDRMELLECFRSRFDDGHIRPDRSDKTFKFETRSIGTLTAKVIPHFREYPLLSGKRRDFELFAEAVEMMERSSAHRRRRDRRVGGRLPVLRLESDAIRRGPRRARPAPRPRRRLQRSSALPWTPRVCSGFNRWSPV